MPQKAEGSDGKPVTAKRIVYVTLPDFAELIKKVEQVWGPDSVAYQVLSLHSGVSTAALRAGRAIGLPVRVSQDRQAVERHQERLANGADTGGHSAHHVSLCGASHVWKQSRRRFGAEVVQMWYKQKRRRDNASRSLFASS